MYPHSITLETTGPTGSVVINDGVAYTNSASVTLKLASPGATQMCIRNNTFASCAFLWEPYSSTKAWTFPSGDGTKTVYVEYQDGAGKVSALYSDSIVLDTSAPTGSVTINGGAAYVTSTSVSLTLAASDPSAVSKMCVSSSTTMRCTWEPYSHTKAWKFPSGDGTKTVYVKYQDSAGNLSPVYSSSVILDTTAPTGSVTINGGNQYTNSQSVKLSLNGSDSNSLAGMCIRNNTTALCSLLWEPYSSTKDWIFPSGDGTKTVYVEYQDTAGNVSAVYSRSIILDATAPVDGVLSAAPGDSQVSLNWSGFSDAGSGIVAYSLVFSTSDSPPDCSKGTKVFSGTGTSYVRYTQSTNKAMYLYRVCAADKAGNISSGATSSATPQGSSSPISVTPTTYDFGNVKVNKSQAVSFMLKNTGTTDLSITSTITGTNASMFKITSERREQSN